MVILLAAFIDLLLPNRTMQRYVKLMLSLIILLILLSPVIKLFDAKLTDEIAVEWEKASADSPAVYESLTSIQREAARMTSTRNSEVLSVAAAQLETNMKAELQQSIQTIHVNSTVDQQQKDAPVLAMEDKQAKVSNVDVKLKQDSTGAPYIDNIVVSMGWTDAVDSRVEQEIKPQALSPITPIDQVQPVRIGERMDSDRSNSNVSNGTSSSSDTAEAYQQSVESEMVKLLTSQWLVKTEQIQFQWST